MSGTENIGAPAIERAEILLVDDDPIQRKLGSLRLVAAGFVVRAAANPEEALSMALARPPQAIMSDVIMGELDGFGFCRRVRQEPRLAAVPVILLSAHFGGRSDQDLARKLGACSLVARTPTFEEEIRALRESLRSGPPRPAARPSDLVEDQLRSTNNQLSIVANQARNAEQRYRALFDAAPDLVAVLTPDGTVVDVNRRAEELLGQPRAELIGRRFTALIEPQSSGAAAAATAADSGPPTRAITLFQRPDGSTVHLETSVKVVEIDGASMVLSIGRDVTDFVAATRALAVAEDNVRSVVQRIRDVVWTTTGRGGITFITPNVADVLGISPAEVYAGGPAVWTARIHPDDLGPTMAATQMMFDTERPLDIEFRWARSPNHWIRVRSRAAVHDRGGKRHAEGMLSDVTEQRQLEESFRQAQKMEAIGRLTGGIAHDFNNVVGTILAHAHFLLGNLSDADPRRPDAEEIRLSAERAAALTRQLLAFSRRQVLAPRVVDLNTIVGGVERMLRRLIGEDIDLDIVRAPDLRATMADPGQIEQVIMNLVVNARDAMPRGGRLRIETANVELEAPLAASPEPIAIGRYVRLTVADTGCGMTADTRAQAFEPFFTTKERGTGTGLGLSTCYGIVKQSGGYIGLTSEPERGATFAVYLPQVDARAEQPVSTKSTTGGEPRGNETVLLIEDDTLIRNAITRILTSRGYKVLAARDGRDATQLVDQHAAAIDLVVSDVIIPGTNGPEIVRDIQRRATRARVLFMSGYTEHAVLAEGRVQENANFIQKPFAPAALGLKIREILDG
ncbi:MAG: response regulator [Verrucomicrobiota bacterium]